MKTKSVIFDIAKTEQGKALLQELLAVRESTLATMADVNAPDMAIRFMSGRLSVLNELINNLQDRR